jgi:hypothetical protein
LISPVDQVLLNSNFPQTQLPGETGSPVESADNVPHFRSS